MASSSSSSPLTWTYRVFTSFHGSDVRKTFLSHLRKQFDCKGITMFDDERMERSQMIAPTLTQAIRESRISIVVLSENYASSSWCLDELLEILKCKEDIGQIVMTVFCGVDPSDVRKQTGEFGIAFNDTCVGKTDEEKRKWSQALNYVGNIAGEHFLNWENEAKMIEKIAKDVLDKLNATPSRDFDGMVGLEAHLKKMQSLLDLNFVGVKIVGITGPAGIGKTTIARALHSRLSNGFQLTCFMENIRVSYNSGFDEYGLKLFLQEQLLSKILNQNGIRICHLGLIQERLNDQKVLIILDDVNKLNQLKALAGDISWFGPGSRIIVTTENKDLLKQHGIDDTYHVDFPSEKEAIEILCIYAFGKNSTYHGFEELAERVTELCGNLPLGLSVVGSSLLGKDEDEWGYIIRRLETILDYQDIEEVLRVGFESLHEDEKSLFLHIAVFFNYKDVDLVEAMFADNNSDIKHGLKILINRSLIYISKYGEIVMHKLLQQVGRQAVSREEPWKRRILIDAADICDVLECAKGTRAVSGISLDTSGIDEVYIGKGAFKRMPNLRFLSVYKCRYDESDRMHIPKEMEFPRRLRLLNWEAYPSKSLPPTFNPEYLVELYMPYSKVKKLWEGIQPLKNLKKMDLIASYHLKELPDLSKATNLEKLKLSYCESLVEIPSSSSHLHKLRSLYMKGCINLQAIPAHMNLASLEWVDMKGCSRLRNIPLMSTNIRLLNIARTAVEDVPPSLKLCSRLTQLNINGGRKLKELTYFPRGVIHIKLRNSDIERIPDCIKALHQLKCLEISGCRRLTSLPEIPPSLIFLGAHDCESLESVFIPFNTPKAHLNFTNCFKLGRQTRRRMIQRSHFHGKTLLPGRKVPAEFDHRAKGNSLTISPDGNPSIGFAVCVVISPNQQFTQEYTSPKLLCRRRKTQGDLSYVEDLISVADDSNFRCFRTKHVFIFQSSLLNISPAEESRELAFEFSSKFQDFDIIGCGARIWTQEEGIEGSYESGSDQASEEENIQENYESGSDKASEEESIQENYESGSDQASEDDNEFEHSEEAFVDETDIDELSNGVIFDSKEEVEKRTDCWSWLFLCFGLSVLGKKTIESGS